MTRGTVFATITVIILTSGCGGDGADDDPTMTEGVTSTLAGVTLKIRPPANSDGLVRPIEEANVYVAFGDAMVAIDTGMNLSVSTADDHPPESFVQYGTVTAGDTVLVDGNNVSVNGQPRSPAN